MATDPEIEKLQIRISQLEDQLKNLRQPQTDITADDLKAHRKVQEALIGVNFCLTECTRCFFCVTFCIFECTCGPCQQERPQSGGLGRFGGLGR
jgi:hypothetical protein